MSSSDDSVGYGKPPKHSRFQKGNSGNPLGRPLGSKNLALLIDRALREKITVSENGKRKRITKAEAISKQLVNKAASGDARAVAQVAQLQALAAQLRRQLEQEMFENVDFAEWSAAKLDKFLYLCTTPEARQAIGLKELFDVKMYKKLLRGDL